MSLRFYVLVFFFLTLSTLLPLSTPAETFSPASMLSPGALTALHAKYDDGCLKCHTLGKGVPDEKCLDCHKVIRERIAAKKGYHAAVHGKCFECHTDHRGREYGIVKKELLKPPAFDHRNTGFLLVGKHATLECNKCHKTGSYLKLQAACLFCHKEPHNKAFEGSLCTDCHSFAAWQPSIFKHDKAKFKLEGPHKDAPCKACHSAGVYRGRKHDKCTDCHSEPHNRQFEPLACAECHKVTGKWAPENFKHDKAKFKLEGPHKDAPCKACHSAGVYRGRKHDSCAECHVDPHKGLRGAVCTKCHKQNSWDLDMDSHAGGLFPLQGRHARLNCTDCHKSGVFTGADRQCASCHADPHRNQFGISDCSKCHTATSWIPPVFLHVQAGFILDGRHRTVNCENCHAGRNYRNTPTQCDRCHQTSYLNSRNPGHQAAGLAGDCRVCHNTSSWRGAQYNHRFYFLYGPHNNFMRCNDCHISSTVYSLNATRCSVCHQQPIHPGHPHPDGDMLDHTKPHRHGHEPCAQCHYTDTWKRTRMPGM